MVNRALEYLRNHERPLAGLVVASLAAFYAITTLPGIGDHPIVGGDEGWIVSASAKLAEDGVFGSDLFSGFYRAEKHYYFNLPLHHVVLAGVFKVFGTGLAQARLTSALFGAAALALTFALGTRVGGKLVGAAAAALLVLLRLNLTPFTGLTLTDLGATVRYDLVAVPFALGAPLLLLGRPETTGWRASAAAGLVLGFGCLTQFIDAFFVLPFALFLLTAPLSERERLLRVAAFGAAVALPMLPYLAYIAQDWHDFRGQSRTVEQRSDVLAPGFYIDNLASEVDRYDLALDIDASLSLAEVTERPSARLALLLAGPAALAYSVWRWRRGSAPHRLLAIVLISLLAEFALFESTKRFVYWVAAVPFLCVAVADLGAALVSWRPKSEAARRLALAAGAGAALLIAAEGLAVGARNVGDAGDAPSYAALGEALREVLPPGSRVVTDNRMWLTLRDMDVRSLYLLFYWTNPEISREEVTDVEGAMRRIDGDYLLLSPLTREILEKLTAEDAARFDRYLGTRARLVATVSGPPYGPIEVYELEP